MTYLPKRDLHPCKRDLHTLMQGQHGNSNGKETYISCKRDLSTPVQRKHRNRNTFVKETYFYVKETHIYVQETYIHPCRGNTGTGIQRRLLGTQDSSPQHFSRTQKRPTFVKETYFYVKEIYIYVHETYTHPCRENMGTGIQRRLLGTQDSKPQHFSRTQKRPTFVKETYFYVKETYIYVQETYIHPCRENMGTGIQRRLLGNAGLKAPALLSNAKETYICKRDLFLCKRDLYLCTRDLHTSVQRKHGYRNSASSPRHGGLKSPVLLSNAPASFVRTEYTSQVQIHANPSFL